MTRQLLRDIHLEAARSGISVLFCVVLVASSASGYSLLDFPSHGAVASDVYKKWVLDSASPRSLTLSYSIAPDLLGGLEGAAQAAASAIASWDAVSPIIDFLDAGYSPVVNSQDNWEDGGYCWEGPGAAAGGVGIGANIDIMSRPADFEFTLLGKTYDFGDNSLAFTMPVVMSGNILSTDVYLNSDYAWAVEDHFDVETVILHELGHALGLDHPNQAAANGAENYYPWSNVPGKPFSPAEVMYSTYSGIKQSLTMDEVGGLAFIYGLTQGDANLDNIVDVADLSTVCANWGAQTDWTGGDFDWDGQVNIADLTTVAVNWGTNGGQIPEPATAWLVGLVVAGMVGRKRQR